MEGSEVCLGKPSQRPMTRAAAWPVGEPPRTSMPAASSTWGDEVPSFGNEEDRSGGLPLHAKREHIPCFCLIAVLHVAMLRTVRSVPRGLEMVLGAHEGPLKSTMSTAKGTVSQVSRAPQASPLLSAFLAHGREGAAAGRARLLLTHAALPPAHVPQAVTGHRERRETQKSLQVCSRGTQRHGQGLPRLQGTPTTREDGAVPAQPSPSLDR
ncbi:uncharacterized protein LOC107137463 isoform X2 [Marmota marmota marmota]|uniref:uncharacterized protein LOC107137463 isoform X2 n=1 Tax=Marmota marmota marmota TaxID=9994 RepID=UPI0020929FA2|nr:uncharacterized protein LOC107137463 isoform X2 [Marmota marmota marmota]XP_048666831.1 uncharacterized protein LOC107137463 isoform X2 [Marmota marmota marmota]